MSKYTLIVTPGGDSAALYHSETGAKIIAGHGDDVKDRLLGELLRAIVEIREGQPIMPDGKWQWSDVFPTLADQERHARRSDQEN